MGWPLTHPNHHPPIRHTSSSILLTATPGTCLTLQPSTFGTPRLYSEICTGSGRISGHGFRRLRRKFGQRGEGLQTNRLSLNWFLVSVEGGLPGRHRSCSRQEKQVRWGAKVRMSAVPGKQWGNDSQQQSSGWIREIRLIWRCGYSSESKVKIWT